ncbi:DUF3047 domain-containing protein [Nitrosomonas communis]
MCVLIINYYLVRPPQVNVAAIMTDTNNTGSTTTAWYGDIW